MKRLKIGIVCSGGDAPGINNLIYGLFEKFKNAASLLGFIDGFEGIYEKNYINIDENIVDSIQLEGSSIIGCERFEKFIDTKIQDEIVSNLIDLNIDHLIILGGNGSLKAAKILKNKKIKIHFVPTTIDNDVDEVSTTLGFDTALNGITEYIRRINYSAKNHKKIQFYELMGRDCSDLTNFIGKAVYADFVINNSNYDDVDLVNKIVNKINHSKKRTNIVLISERLLDTKVLLKKISDKIKKRIWFSVVGHFQRGGVPTFNDCLYGSNCSKAIYNNILEDKYDLIYSINEEVEI